MNDFEDAIRRGAAKVDQREADERKRKQDEEEAKAGFELAWKESIPIIEPELAKLADAARKAFGFQVDRKPPGASGNNLRESSDFHGTSVTVWGNNSGTRFFNKTAELAIGYRRGSGEGAVVGLDFHGNDIVRREFYLPVTDAAEIVRALHSWLEGLATQVREADGPKAVKL